MYSVFKKFDLSILQQRTRETKDRDREKDSKGSIIRGEKLKKPFKKFYNMQGQKLTHIDSVLCITTTRNMLSLHEYKLFDHSIILSLALCLNVITLIAQSHFVL